MKTKISRSILYVLIPILIIFSSCEDFIEVDPPFNMINSDIVFNDERTAQAALLNVYSKIRTSGFLSGSFEGAGCLLGCYTDELTSYDAINTSFQDFYSLSLTSNHNTITNLWNTTYNQIYDINSVLEGLGKSNSLEPELINQLKSEALFLRALLHFYLTNTYDAIPYVNTTDYQKNRNIGKESLSKIYLKCLEDLNIASELISETFVKHRASKFAIQALKARIYLYSKKWEEAIFYATEVINSNQYTIEPIESRFLKDSKSTIWHLQAATTTANTSEATTYIFNTVPPSKVALTDSFVQGFKTDDSRKNTWIKQVDENYNYYHPFKYTQDLQTPLSQEYSIVLRIEEMYLIRMEALTNLGNKVEALQDLNFLREHNNQSFIEDIATIDMNEEIRYQRKYEFFTEFGHRFYDLKRWQLLNDIMIVEKPNWQTIYKTLPLPQKEIQLNPQLLPQNEGYL